MVRIVAVETYGRFPAGKTCLGLYFVEYSRMYGKGHVGPLLTKHYGTMHAMRVLPALVPLMALFSGRVVTPH